MDQVRSFVFLGSKALGLEVLRTTWRLRPGALRAVVTFDDSADARSVLQQFVAFGKETGVRVHIAQNPRHAEEIIVSVEPDLCFVVCWYWLLSESVIRRLPSGAIGVHNSLLPKYRGGSPLVWAIINGETEAGFSLFSFTQGMDEGDIWLQEKVTISPGDTIDMVSQHVQQRLLDVLNARWCALLDGEVRPYKQRHELATYCAQRFPGDGRIDWRWPADRVFNFIRALSPPYPHAFISYQEKQVLVAEAEVFGQPYYGTPGQVARSGDAGVYVICGDNRAVILRTLIVDGERQPARNVLPSIKIRLDC